jgi:hypothetical protein
MLGNADPKSDSLGEPFPLAKILLRLTIMTKIITRLMGR